MKIVEFYLVRSPCEGQSAHRITLNDYGWDQKRLGNEHGLTWSVDYGLGASNGKTLYKVKKLDEMYEAAKSVDLLDSHWMDILTTRAVFLKSPRGSSEKYMSLIYHLRNSLAHGRFSARSDKSDALFFVFEDGRLNSNGFPLMHAE